MESGYKWGKSHAFRQRCQTILLKSECRSSKEVGQIVKMHQVSVNTWADRYEAEGISGLHTKPGRGRKPGLEKERDTKAVMAAVQANRQSLGAAKAAYEAEKESVQGLSEGTLRRFLKALTADTGE